MNGILAEKLESFKLLTPLGSMLKITKQNSLRLKQTILTPNSANYTNKKETKCQILLFKNSLSIKKTTPKNENSSPHKKA